MCVCVWWLCLLLIVTDWAAKMVLALPVYVDGEAFARLVTMVVRVRVKQ